MTHQNLCAVNRSENVRYRPPANAGFNALSLKSAQCEPATGLLSCNYLRSDTRTIS